MAPRFVEVRRIPLENETISAVIIEGAQHAFSDAMRFAEWVPSWIPSWGDERISMRFWQVDGLSGWVGDRVGEWVQYVEMGERASELMRSIPKSSKLCFMLCMLCFVVAMCAYACIVCHEWRRLHRMYAK